VDIAYILCVCTLNTGHVFGARTSAERPVLPSQDIAPGLDELEKTTRFGSTVFTVRTNAEFVYAVNVINIL